MRSRSQPPIIPEDRDQRLVKTPYGEGLVIRTRPNDKVQEVKLLEWERASKESQVAAKQYRGSKQPLMMYSAAELESTDAVVGDDVICSYGRGTVTKCIKVHILSKKDRSEFPSPADDGGSEEEKKGDDELNTSEAPRHGVRKGRTLTKYQVELKSWRLAGRSKVRCYLFRDAIKVVRRKMLSEMSAQERVEFAQRQKASALQSFKEKRYQQALNLYAGAVDAVRYVQHDASSSNETRADLVVVMVTCSNNAATCCVQLGRWKDAARFAQNALVLLDALYGKRGLKIHTILIADERRGGNDLCDAKLFGEWRVKSYLVVAKAQAQKKEYTEANEILRRARSIILEYTADANNEEVDSITKASITNLLSQDKAIRRFIANFAGQKKAEKEKQKKRAQAMFGGGKTSSKVEALGRSDTKMAKNSDENGLGHLEEEEKKESKTPPTSPKSMATETKDMEAPAADTSDVLSHKVAAPPNRQSSLKNCRPPSTLKRRVSFSNEVSERQITNDYESDKEEDEIFLEQHKEALIMVGIMGLAALSAYALRSLSRQR